MDITITKAEYKALLRKSIELEIIKNIMSRNVGNFTKSEMLSMMLDFYKDDEEDDF